MIWSSDIISVSYDEQIDVLSITTNKPFEKNHITKCSFGNKSSRAILCVTGVEIYSGFWIAHMIEGCNILCKASSDNLLWNSKYSIMIDESISLIRQSAVDNNKQKPQVCIAPPLYFYCRTTLFGIDKIDTVNQSFQCDLYVELRLRNIIDTEDNEAIDALMKSYNIGLSYIDFLNVSEIIGEKENWSAFSDNWETVHQRTTNDSKVIGLKDYSIKIRMKAIFSEQMEVENFPWDVQTMNICLTFNSCTSRVILKNNNEYPSIFMNKKFQLASVYNVLLEDNVFVIVDHSDPSESSAQLIYSRCIFKVFLERKSGYYISNILMPLTVLTLLGTYYNHYSKIAELYSNMYYRSSLLRY
jgi:hypothetical protein